jgi:hypothetical protein
MASITFNYLYALVRSEADPDLFQSVRSYNVTQTLHSNDDPDAIEFNVGDMIIANPDDVPLIYVGRIDNGIVAQHMGDFTYYLFSSGPYTEPTLTLNAAPYPVCFVKGTLITTSQGPVAIELLVAGDLVQGSTGWRTVKWVGWRNYGAASFFTQESKSRVAPVRIREHSIADNVPSSDLLTSPWHHLLVDGKLVRAGDLVNGTTITQETHVNEVSYYHVELDQFDVIMAHGVYSESYADGGNRDFFQNVEVTSLRPEDKIRRRASRPGFDHLVLRQSKELVAIQDRIAQRAKAIASIETQKQKVA